MKIFFEHNADDGFERIEFTGDKFSFGRGGDADRRFSDDGLSRLHATVYRENGHIWVVDENSTNGTKVNGVKVEAGGTPLDSGDEIEIGNFTRLKVKFEEENGQEKPTESNAVKASEASAHEPPKAKTSILLPVAITFIALFIIFGAAGLVAYALMNSGAAVAQDDGDSGFGDIPDSTPETSENQNSASEDPAPSNSTSTNIENTVSESPLTESPSAESNGTSGYSTGGKKYQQMSDAEKNAYIKAKAELVARIIGNKSGSTIPPEAVARIRQYVDSYAKRIRAQPTDTCEMGRWVSSDLGSVLGRARKNAPFIIRSFNQKGIAPQIGLYLAFIESEHCPCLQSPTGPLGLFQFTRATGAAHGLETRAGASVSNPDQRCDPRAASDAAASYMKTLTGRIGTGPISVPLAIASYNSGEGGLGKNLRVALEANSGADRSFWTLVSNADMLAKQFQSENIKYVPKYFAAAIIGENPRDFGIDAGALSTYSN